MKDMVKTVNSVTVLDLLLYPRHLLWVLYMKCDGIIVRMHCLNIKH